MFSITWSLEMCVASDWNKLVVRFDEAVWLLVSFTFLRRKSLRRGVSNLQLFSDEILAGELLAVRIFRSDELGERPLRPVEVDAGLPRRASGHDCRGELLLWWSTWETADVSGTSDISNSFSDCRSLIHFQIVVQYSFNVIQTTLILDSIFIQCYTDNSVSWFNIHSMLYRQHLFLIHYSFNVIQTLILVQYSFNVIQRTLIIDSIFIQCYTDNIVSWYNIHSMLYRQHWFLIQYSVNVIHTTLILNSIFSQCYTDNIDFWSIFIQCYTDNIDSWFNIHSVLYRHHWFLVQYSFNVIQTTLIHDSIFIQCYTDNIDSWFNIQSRLYRQYWFLIQYSVNVIQTILILDSIFIQCYTDNIDSWFNIHSMVYRQHWFLIQYSFNVIQTTLILDSIFIQRYTDNIDSWFNIHSMLYRQHWFLVQYSFNGIQTTLILDSISIQCYIANIDS